MNTEETLHKFRAETNLPPTRPTMIQRACDPDPKISRKGFEELYIAYCNPLYGYLRKNGRSPEEAQDLIQGFFVHLIEKNVVGKIRREGFRHALLRCLKNFNYEAYRRERAKKRGEGKLISLDFLQAEADFKEEAGNNLPPDEFYDHLFALDVVNKTMILLEIEAGQTEHSDWFKDIKEIMYKAPDGPSYQQLSEKLGVEKAKLQAYAAKLRERFRVIFREQVQHIAFNDQVDEEMKGLMNALCTSKGILS